MPYSRERSRSPVQWGSNYNMDPSGTKLYLANVPKHWNVQHVIKFVKDVTKSIMISQDIAQVNISEDEFGRSRGTCVIQFDTPITCRTAFQNLQGIVCEGKNLLVTLAPDPQFEYNSARPPKDNYPKAETSMNHNKALLSNTQLFVGHLPTMWGPEQIAKFIQYTTNSEALVNAIERVEVIRDSSGNSKGHCVLHFTHPSPCEIVLNELKGAKCQGSKLQVKYNAVGGTGMNDAPRKPPGAESQNDSRGPPKWEDELFGMKKNFLKSLNIKTPLHSIVFVGNLHEKVDEAKLHEVFSFAGQVLKVKIKKHNEKNARNLATIEFDHPLEAVQAISMFHNKGLLGIPMVVLQHKNPQMKFLPDGLQGLGPGLGPNGEPLKGVRYAVQVEPKAQFMMKQIETLTSELEELKSKLRSINSGSNSELNMNNTMTQMVTPVNAVQPVYGYNPMAMNQAQPMMAGMVQPMVGNEMAMSMQAMPNHNLTAMPIQGVPVQAMPAPASNYPAMTPMMQGPVADHNVVVNHWNTENVMAVKPQPSVDTESHKRRSPDYKDRPRYDGDHKKPKRASDMLVFNNLPRNVTESMLRSKMQEVGELKMAELTGGGRALVRFAKEADAERCQEIFHHSKVDGQVIEVDYF